MYTADFTSHTSTGQVTQQIALFVLPDFLTEAASQLLPQDMNNETDGLPDYRKLAGISKAILITVLFMLDKENNKYLPVGCWINTKVGNMLSYQNSSLHCNFVD